MGRLFVYFFYNLNITKCPVAILMATLAANITQNQWVTPNIDRTSDTVKATSTATHHSDFCHCAPNNGRRYAIAPPTKIPPTIAAAIGLNGFTNATTTVIPTIRIILINHSFLLDITVTNFLLDIFLFLAKGQLITCFVTSNLIIFPICCREKISTALAVRLE